MPGRAGASLDSQSQGIALEAFISSLAEEHDDLQARIRTLTHKARSKDGRVGIHAHFLAFRDREPTVGEFVSLLSCKLITFCLHRKYIQDEQKKWSGLSSSKMMERVTRLHHQALDLFKKASRNTNRNGEFGELITFLLIESVLKAPQFVAKMSLKTSTEMPVHGSDGIHLGYDSEAGVLRLYWGESKCHASINDAIQTAVDSIKDNLDHKKASHELFLVEQYFDLAGFPEEFREAILSFLNPYNENYNKRVDVSVMFIAFDFAAFSVLNNLSPEEVEAAFSDQLRKVLPDYVRRLDGALEKSAVKSHTIEVFFLPVPSIAAMRKMFQDRIGWTA
jgi:hypothetical protein